ncbi:MAG TPA: AAA family ATPase, partial [Ktedonobacteraceae bacterium]
MQAPFADPLSGLELLSKPLPLVGRDTEMQLICALLDTVALDRPVGARALTISGDMGVGKSRLLAEMCEQGSVRGFRVLEGRTYETGAMFPYLPFIEALRPVLRSSSVQQLRRYAGLDHKDDLSPPMDAPISLMGTPLVAALARLFPELPRVVRVTITPEVLSPDQEKFRLFDAVATLLEQMGMERPLLLGIDNLQWADSASLELMMYLTVRLHNSHVALVGVTRSPGTFNEREDSGDSVISATANIAAVRALGELMRQGLLFFLPLGPLSADAAEQHLHALLPGNFSEGLAQSLLSRAGGNPFFLEELVRMLTLNGQLTLRDGVWRTTRVFGQELPQGITLAVEQRLQGLSASCRQLLQVASLFGRTFPLYALLTVMQAPEDIIQSLIDEAMQAAVIAMLPPTAIGDEDVDELAGEDALPRNSTSYPAPPTYMFCQGIVQEVLSKEVPTHRARVLHGAIGAALEAGYGGSAQAHAAELARHYVLSGKKDAALRWSLLAGEDAARQQAHREAISHFRMALKLMEAYDSTNTEEALPSPAQLHLSIGESWFKLGELDQALSAFQQAIGARFIAPASSSLLSTPAPSPLLSAHANRLLADVYRMQGKYELALAHLQAARKALDASAGEYEETNAGFDQETHQSWFPSSSFSGDTGAMRLRQVKTTESILLLQAQATLDLLLNRAQEAEEALWRSHQLATEIGDRGSQAFALHLIGWIRGWGEHINEAIRLQEQAHELYVSVGDPFRAALGDQGLGIIYQALGEMEKARL